MSHPRGGKREGSGRPRKKSIRSDASYSRPLNQAEVPEWIQEANPLLYEQLLRQVDEIAFSRPARPAKSGRRRDPLQGIWRPGGRAFEE